MFPGLCELILKGNDITDERCSGLPLERLGVNLAVLFTVGQCATQVVNGFAQIVTCLGFAGIGPEKESYVLARMERLPVQQQIGQQRLHARALHGQNGLFTEPDAKFAEEMNLQA